MHEYLLSIPRDQWESGRMYDGETFLHQAIRLQDLTAVRMLLSHSNANINSESQRGATPLHVAGGYDNSAILRLLLTTRGVDVNARNWDDKNPINTLCQFFNGSTEALRLLCAAGGDPTHCPAAEFYSPLDDCLWNNRASARFLIGIGVRLRSSPRIAIKWRDYESSILCCRSAVATLLKVKDRGRLHRWDRFLLKEIALQVWLTREDWDQ